MIWAALAVLVVCGVGVPALLWAIGLAAAWGPLLGLAAVMAILGGLWFWLPLGAWLARRRRS